MNYPLFAVDLAAIGVLAFALYYPRHRRKDLAVALLGVNIGVFAVTTALATATVGAGLGLGLFGVLSIIRLRSSELSQVEVAYYFAALAIGLIGGMGNGMSVAIAGLLIAAIIAALAVADSKLAMTGSNHMTMVVDKALSSMDELAEYIEHRTGMKVREVSIVRLDYVNDSTMVDVRCSKGRARFRETKALRAA
jgi:hypothetical protein